MSRESVSDFHERKRQIREQAHALRKSQPDKEALSQKICATFVALAEYHRAGTVLFYLDARTEVRTRHYLPKVLGQGKRIVVPYCVEDRLELFHLESADELEIGMFKILEPKPELRDDARKRVSVSDVDLIMVPGVAFDRSGGRMGHGFGYYDKLLEHARPDTPLVALAFECQLFSEVPATEHDIYMDKIVTESAVYIGRGPIDLARLKAGSWLAHVEHHPMLTSTNDRARLLAGEDECRLPLLVIADEQTSGRGRGGNRWWTGPGSLACSLLFDPAARGIERRFFPMLSLAAAVSLIEVVRPLLPDHVVGLHWPNDVFAEGRKLAGILVEALPDGRHILGIGFNVNNSVAQAPVELSEIVTSLVDLALHEHDRMQLLLTLFERLGPALDQLAAQPELLARRADEMCLQHGRSITIESGRRRATGICTGIAPDGALVLDTPSGPEVFYSGVLTHGH